MNVYEPPESRAAVPNPAPQFFAAITWIHIAVVAGSVILSLADRDLVINQLVSDAISKTAGLLAFLFIGMSLSCFFAALIVAGKLRGYSGCLRAIGALLLLTCQVVALLPMVI